MSKTKNEDLYKRCGNAIKRIKYGEEAKCVFEQEGVTPTELFVFLRTSKQTEKQKTEIRSLLCSQGIIY